MDRHPAFFQIDALPAAIAAVFVAARQHLAVAMKRRLHRRRQVLE